MESVSASAGMVRDSLGMQESMVMQLINSGAQQAQAAASGGGELRTATLNSQGIGQSVNITV